MPSRASSAESFDPNAVTNKTGDFGLYRSASARASFGVYNTKDDLDKLNEGINNCKKIFDLK